MSEEQIEKVLAKIEGLPPLPAAVTKLCRLSASLDTDVREIAGVISEDQALTARLLRLANSAFYGLSQQVKTVSHAVVILGYHEVRNLAMGVSLIGSNLGKSDSSPLDVQDFWRHSLVVACGARLLGERLGLPQPDEVFVAGLLHDIGKLIFMEYFPEPYGDVVRKARAGENMLFKLEKESLGMSHAMVGRKLCRHWKLPNSLADAVAFHHRSPETSSTSEEGRAAEVVRIADALAKILPIGTGGENHVEKDVFSTGSAQQLHPGTLCDVLHKLPDEVNRSEELFNLTPSAPASPVAGDGDPRLVLLTVNDPNIYKVASVTLHAADCTPMCPDDVAGSAETRFVAVVADTVSAGLAKLCSTHGIPALDLSTWREEGGLSKSGALDSRKLREWLEEKLSCSVREESA